MYRVAGAILESPFNALVQSLRSVISIQSVYYYQESEMKPRERVAAALRREEADRVPVCELNIDRAFAEQIDGASSFIGNAALQTGNPFSLEEALALSDNLGLDNIFYLARQPIYAHMHEGKDGRLFPGDGKIKTRADMAMIDLPDPTRDEYYAEAELFAKNKGDKSLWYLTRGGLAPVMLCMGMDHFSLTLYDDLDFVKEMLKVYFDWVVEVAKRVNQLGFDVFATADDCAFKSGLMFSPQTYREIVAPHYARISKELDIPWLFHSDGDITEVVPMLIENGVTAVHPFENTAMDIRAAKRKFGDDICIVGNVDLNLLGGSDPAAVDREIFELIRDLGPGGGYIVCSGNSLAGFLNPACVRAYVDAVKKYGRYPINLA